MDFPSEENSVEEEEPTPISVQPQCSADIIIPAPPEFGNAQADVSTAVSGSVVSIFRSHTNSDLEMLPRLPSDSSSQAAHALPIQEDPEIDSSTVVVTISLGQPNLTPTTSEYEPPSPIDLNIRASAQDSQRSIEVSESESDASSIQEVPSAASCNSSQYDDYLRCSPKLSTVTKPNSKFNLDSPMDSAWKMVSIPQHSFRHSMMRNQSRHRNVFDAIAEEEDDGNVTEGFNLITRSEFTRQSSTSMDAQTWEQYRSQQNILSAPLSGIIYKASESVENGIGSQVSSGHVSTGQSCIEKMPRYPSPRPGPSARRPSRRILSGSSKNNNQEHIDGISPAATKSSKSVTKFRNAMTMSNFPTNTGKSGNPKLQSDIRAALAKSAKVHDFVQLSRECGNCLGGPQQIDVLFASENERTDTDSVVVYADDGDDGAESVGPSEDGTEYQLSTASSLSTDTNFTNTSKTSTSSVNSGIEWKNIVEKYGKQIELTSSEPWSAIIPAKDEALQPFVSEFDTFQPLIQMTQNFQTTVQQYNVIMETENMIKPELDAGAGTGTVSAKTKASMVPLLKKPSKNQNQSQSNPSPDVKEIEETFLQKDISNLESSDEKPRSNEIGTQCVTPIVKLTKIPKEFNIECEILLKCEHMNTTGVASYRMIKELLEHHESDGNLGPEYTIVCSTNVASGLGIALAAASKGYQPPIIVLSDNDATTSDIDLLTALGAKVVRCPADKTGVTLKDYGKEICEKLLQVRSKTWHLDFEKELINTTKHTFSTGREILEQCQKKADLLICDADSAMLLNKITSEMTGHNGKERCKLLALETDIFIKQAGKVATWYPYIEKEGIIMARKLIRDEGILCGVLGGALVDCALKAAADFKIDQNKEDRIVILFPGGLVQGSKQFLNNQWMIDRNYWLDSDMESLHYWWWDLPISIVGIKQAVTVNSSLTIRKALYIFETCNVNRLVLTSENDYTQKSLTKGVLTKENILKHIKDKEKSLAKEGGSTLQKNTLDLDNIFLSEIPPDENTMTATVFMKLKDAARAFKTCHFLIIVQREDALFYKANVSTTEKLQNVVGVVSPLDVLQYKKSIMEDHRKRFGMTLKG